MLTRAAGAGVVGDPTPSIPSKSGATGNTCANSAVAPTHSARARLSRRRDMLAAAVARERRSGPAANRGFCARK